MAVNKLRETWDKIRLRFGRFRKAGLNEMPQTASNIFHLRDFKKNFVTGVATVIPLIVTLYVFYLFVKTFGGNLAGLLQVIPPLRRIPKFFLMIISLGVGVFAVYVVGTLTGHWAGEGIVAQLESIFLKIPLVKAIYVPAKELTQALIGQEKMAFRKVVLIEFPERGTYALGFLTSYFVMDKERFFNVFVPTTPNPTSGWYLILPEEKVRILEMKPETALKIIVSGGIVFPEEFAQDIASEIRGLYGHQNEEKNEKGRGITGDVINGRTK